jgi:hypothetical protein
MTHDTHNERPGSQDELLAHVIPMRHRAADPTQLHDEEPTDELTPLGEHTLWDPSSDPPLPRRRNTSAASTADTTPPLDAGLAPDTGPSAHRASPRALRAALAGLTAAAALAFVLLALHSRVGATPRPPALVSNTPDGGATMAPEYSTRLHQSKKNTTHTPQHYWASTPQPPYTPVAPPATVTVSAPVSVPAQSHSTGATQEFGFER